jgi:hypothetical protein
MENTPISGNVFLGWLHEQGVIPDWVQRVVIEATAGSIVKVYIEAVGKDNLIRVDAPPELKGATVVIAK